MLIAILQALREAHEPLGLAELASRLEIDASALEGMLEQLVHQGKLRKSEEMTTEECEREHKSGMYGNLCAFPDTRQRGDALRDRGVIESRKRRPPIGGGHSPCVPHLSP